jgi:hypothetical protein
MGAPDINDCDQTAEGLSKKMFEDETFERWCVPFSPLVRLWHCRLQCCSAFLNCNGVRGEGERSV